MGWKDEFKKGFRDGLESTPLASAESVGWIVAFGGSAILIAFAVLGLLAGVIWLAVK